MQFREPPLPQIDFRAYQQEVSERWARHTTNSVTASQDIAAGLTLANATSGDITLTLPPVADAAFEFLWVMKIDSSTNKVVIDGSGSETINGAANQTLWTQYDFQQLYCDGTAWYVVAVKDDPIYGVLYLNANSTAQTLGAATAEKLDITSSGDASGVTQGSSTLTVIADGVYHIIFDATIAFDTAASELEFYLRKNAVEQPAGSFVTVKNANENYTVSFNWTDEMAAADAVTVYVESDKAGDLTVVECQFSINRLHG